MFVPSELISQFVTVCYFD